VKFEYSQTFETYWKALPEKAQACGKKAAFSSWKTAMKNGATVDEIMAGLERWKASRSWAEGFVTYATTWLNQERWTVQPEQAGAGRAKVSMDDWAGQKSGDVA